MKLELQAVGRLVRLGQKKEVHIFSSYIKSSIDAKYADMHVQKASDARDITGDAQIDPLYDMRKQKMVNVIMEPEIIEVEDDSD